ncbi:hypothetical protein SeMB42_g01139 [Synchytrium endobioticum]|uniref:Uncharacterized protein n=1 Tax=Synchytrium endobioticum TaxID=286115 RepID=A0A507D3U2_9FUNG|nr:hypothetical protein SeLEV6574_g03565 [Synchytrium endobioticum]TPX52822.1 hypothetical protein SeMB42_g01139 [Synchytrium endobioticum]
MYLPAPSAAKFRTSRPLLTPYSLSRVILVALVCVALIAFAIYSYHDVINGKAESRVISRRIVVEYDDISVDALQKELSLALASYTKKKGVSKIDHIANMFKELKMVALYTARAPSSLSDFAELGRRLRTYKLLFEIYHDYPQLKARLQKWPEWSDVEGVLTAMETELFPWMFSAKKWKNAKQLRDSYNGRGIVMTTGQWHFRFAHHAILALRTLIKTDLPIELFYAGRYDLDDEHIKILSDIPNVTVIDVTTIVGDDGGLGGWAVKPFSMLASSFREIVFMDADALFFQDPAVLFDYERYNSTGTVFYRDRTVKGWDKNLKEWFATLLPDPSDLYKQSRIFKELSVHEQDSGVVVLDKVRSFHGLLAVCKMNGHNEHTEVYKHMHGDKETFWISFEMTRVPYAWSPFYGGAVGYLSPDGAVCGGLLHPDESGNPLWFNGGRGVSWKWETPTTPFCLEIAVDVTTEERRDVIELTNEQKALAGKYVDLWRQCCDY